MKTQAAQKPVLKEIVKCHVDGSFDVHFKMEHWQRPTEYSVNVRGNFAAICDSTEVKFLSQDEKNELRHLALKAVSNV